MKRHFTVAVPEKNWEEIFGEKKPNKKPKESRKKILTSSLKRAKI